MGKPPKEQLSECSVVKSFPQTQLAGRLPGLHPQRRQTADDQFVNLREYTMNSVYTDLCNNLAEGNSLFNFKKNLFVVRGICVTPKIEVFVQFEFDYIFLKITHKKNNPEI